MDYHAHIYWRDAAERETAMGLRIALHDMGCGLGRIWNRAIGPHPRSMYQVMYTGSVADMVEGYLKSEAASLSILLHENVGKDHKRDHTEGARWIGAPLALKLDVFD